MAVECPRCASYNAEGALHCDQCGAALRGGGASRRKPGAALIAVSALAAGLALLLVLDRGGGRESPPPGEEGRVALREPRPSPPETPPERPQPSPPPPVEELLLQGTGGSSSRIIAGWLQFEGAQGNVLGRVAVGATRGGWIAVPRREALGATRWVFRPGLGGETEVLDGIWAPGEEVGLWRIDTPDLDRAPPLDAWQESEEITFVSFSGNRTEPLATPSELRQEGLFLTAEIGQDLRAGGVLLTEGTVVGWGLAGERAGERSRLCLWAGGPGPSLGVETTVADFYARTFAGGREARLEEAHHGAEGGAAPAVVLPAYGAALRAEPRLQPEDRRERWEVASAVLPVARAMRELLDGGSTGVILAALGIEEVRTLRDPAVFLLWIDALAEVDGPEAGLAALDRHANELVPVGSPMEEPLLSRILALLREVVRRRIDDGDVGRAWAWIDDGRQRFPDDSDLYLSEVELWLMEGNWSQAEQLLGAVSFPATFSERVARLERWISELKGAEGRIVIRFQPGAGAITTHADVAGVEQRFLVDTGASYTSLPWSTIERLGIRIDERTPRRQLRTASDVIEVPIVVVPSITLGGWTVADVEVTVLDLPGGGGLGLLGLNFLGNFTLEMDRSAGRLTLSPK